MKDFLVIAHRGASHLAPENTLPAFRMAMDLKADMIETDIRISADQVPVLSHDADMERIAGTTVYIDELTLVELRGYDFGSWFSESFAGTRIPTLEDLLSLAKGEILLNLEIKKDTPRTQGIEDKVLDAVAAKDMEDQVLISSFDLPALERVRHLGPGIRIGFLYDGNGSWRHFLDHAVKLGAVSFHPAQKSVTPDMVHGFHRRGIRVYPYVVDQISRVKELQTWGVDGVFTNRPEIFQEGRDL
ncbi:MAG: glycerophosphodiester phosphodiesterase family protein [bacterium]